MPLIPTLPPLNAIVDADAAERAGWNIVDLASAYLNGGARFLQIRAKHAASGWLLDAASAVVARARACSRDAVVMVNDRADIARLAEADGVHVGQHDLSPAAVRVIVGADRLVGRSTHTLTELDAALAEPVSYLAIGPVFATSTKDTGHDPIGLEMVRDGAKRARSRGLPLVAIGGITLDRAAGVIDAGATSVAVIGDLLATGDPESRVREYLQRLKRT